jgi:hypothetical protein
MKGSYIMTMKRNDKVQIIIDLLADGNGRFTVAELLAKAGSERRARSAIFLARQAGCGLEPIRDGREVISYISAKIGAEQRAVANAAAKAVAATKATKPVKVKAVKPPKQVKAKVDAPTPVKRPKGATPVPGQPTQYDMPMPARSSWRGKKSYAEELADILKEDGPAIVAMGKRNLGPEGALEVEEITEKKVA